MNLPVVFGVIFFASFVFQLLPALAVLTGGDHNDIAAVVQMVERIARLRSDAVHVALALERQQIRFGRGGKILGVDRQNIAASL